MTALSLPPAATPVAPAAPAAPARNVWLDVLRATALVEVLLYHSFGWPLLVALYPSMGLMFALGGSLMAGSLDRNRGGHYKLVLRRLQRIVPPVWLLGLIVVPLMIWHGWTATKDAGAPFSWATLWLWLVPISTPPGSAWAADWTVPLWYIRTYLWFVVLSAPTLWLWRRWPTKAFAAPAILLVLLSVGALKITAPTGDVVLDLATFGVCWLLGYAHHDGRIRNLPWRQVLPLGATLVTGGLIWAVTHEAGGSWDVNDIPIAHAMFSIGGVLILLRCNPRLAWWPRRPRLAGMVELINARAMTIYLWNNVALFVGALLLDAWRPIARWDDGSARGQLLQFGTGCLALVLMVLAGGWVEDVAARRRPRLLPRASAPVSDRPVPATAPVTDLSTDLPAGPGAEPVGEGPRVVVFPRPRTVLFSIVAIAVFSAAAWGVRWPVASRPDGFIELTIPQLPVAPSTASTSTAPAPGGHAVAAKPAGQPRSSTSKVALHARMSKAPATSRSTAAVRPTASTTRPTASKPTASPTTPRPTSTSAAAPTTAPTTATTPATASTTVPITTTSDPGPPSTTAPAGTSAVGSTGAVA
jgi:hypothetical protein